ncbi:ribosome silencing factor [bacterium]|nr:ribosome silencing factor [bacterium]
MKATDIVVLDMQGTSSFTDYVIIASSSNTRQVVSIADKISMDLKREFGKYAIGVEGKVGGQWVLIDYGDVVCHLFLEETREFYRLEKLWHDAKTLKL